MSNKPNKTKKNKTKITKISASSHQSNNTDTNKPQIPESKPPIIKTKPDQKSHAGDKAISTDSKPTKSKKPFILLRPFIAFGRYLRDSWRELRQVRWPNRKLTWKLTAAVLIYCAIFVVFIVLLDMFFTFIFNLLLS